MEFLDAACMFQKVHILSLNLNTNFALFRWKSRGLLSFEYVRLSYPRNGFQLCAEGGAQKWKSNDSLTNVARKYFSYIT